MMPTRCRTCMQNATLGEGVCATLLLAPPFYSSASAHPCCLMWAFTPPCYVPCPLSPGSYCGPFLSGICSYRGLPVVVPLTRISRISRIGILLRCLALVLGAGVRGLHGCLYTGVYADQGACLQKNPANTDGHAFKITPGLRRPGAYIHQLTT